LPQLEVESQEQYWSLPSSDFSFTDDISRQKPNTTTTAQAPTTRVMKFIFTFGSHKTPTEMAGQDFQSQIRH
jgi:hypothetical protein